LYQCNERIKKIKQKLQTPQLNYEFF